MSIFKIEENLLIIDKDYIRGVPAFRRILERDKGSEKDYIGLKKYRAFKEFFFIFIYKDLSSYPNMGGYNDKECFKIAVKEAGLEEDFKPDNDLKIAIEKYIEIQTIQSITSNTINTILKGLKLSNTISQNLIEDIEYQIELSNKIKKNKIDNNEPANITEALAITKTLISQLDILTDIANNIPKTIDTLQKLEEKVRKEQNNYNTGRGGEEIANSADPNKRKYKT